MKILNFSVEAVAANGVKEVEGVKREWHRLDIVATSVNGIKETKLTLWGHDISEDHEDGTTTKIRVYRSSLVKKDSKLRRKWWIPVSKDNPAIVESVSKDGNKYLEVLPTDVPEGWDVKAFYYPELGKIGISFKVKENI